MHSQVDTTVQSRAGCSCRRLVKQNVLRSFGPFTYRSDVIGVHRPGCPSFGKDQEGAQRTVWTADIRSAGICLALDLSHSLGIGSRLPPSLHFIPIVDGDHAPSFKRFRQAEKEVAGALNTTLPLFPWPWSGKIDMDVTESVREAMRRLLEGVKEDLALRKYSARDKDIEGKTLLHAFSKLLISVWRFQDEIVYIIVAIVQLLVQSGVDVNAVSHFDTVYGFINRPRYTALSMCMESIGQLSPSPLGLLVSIPKIFCHYEIDAYAGRREDHMQEIMIFPKVPELALEFGCSQLSMAIVQRDYAAVSVLAESERHNVNDVLAAPYTPLCFAIGWPAGFARLLKAGANPSFAIHCAIAYGDVLAVRACLQGGSRLFSTHLIENEGNWWADTDRASSVLSYALPGQRIWRRGGMCDENLMSILEAIVQAIAVARRNLMGVALRHLTFEQRQHFGWLPSYSVNLVPDFIAKTLAEKLSEQGLSVPESLWPSSKTSIYHDNWMISDVIAALFKAGFRDVDLPDDNGRTPLLLNCHFDATALPERLRAMQELLELGARKVVFEAMNYTSIVHLLAANLGREWSIRPPIHGERERHDNQRLSVTAKQWIKPVLNLVCPLLGESYSYRDHCSCFCSGGGCTPVHALLKHLECDRYDLHEPTIMWPSWKDETSLLNVWSECVTRCSLPPAEEKGEICRYQLFNRLGMRHTCCRIYFYILSVKVVDARERAEIQQEDEYPNQQLEKLMVLFHRLQGNYADTEGFWHAWWKVVDEKIPPVNWTDWFDDRRHVQLNTHLVPIEESEFPLRLQEIESEVESLMADTTSE